MTSPALDPATQPDTVAEVRRARRALIVVGLIVPAVLTAVTVALVALWIPELPDPAAMHWGADGVDGFAPPAAYLWLAAVLGLGLPLLLVTATLSMARTQWGVTARFLGALALGLSAFSAVIAAGSVWMQRGLEDAAAATDVLPVMIGAFCALLVLSAVGWVLQPDVAATSALTLKTAHVRSIAAGERVVWMGTATMARPGVLVIGLAGVMLVGVTGVMLLQAPDKVWIPLLVLVVVGIALAATASFRVRAGADGLTVRSQLGAPRLHVPLDEITSVRAIECHPFAEFGGVGWRVALDGRTGVVLRSGPAIEVGRRGKGAVVVTVDGAETAAATLQAHLEHRGAAR
ncbi:DUF1648 domain-containing protein [Microbacterium sp. NPDC089321]|uniref:DUF1648 domain-containing protein n=1 Tax=Microbacterium sp. NPDC089321 TaxID=3155183 RepID=UPI00342716F4